MLLENGPAAVWDLLSIPCVCVQGCCRTEMLGLVLLPLWVGFWLGRSTAVKDTLGVAVLVLDPAGLLGH